MDWWIGTKVDRCSTEYGVQERTKEGEQSGICTRHCAETHQKEAGLISIRLIVAVPVGWAYGGSRGHGGTGSTKLVPES